MPTEFRILGPLEVLRDGEVVALAAAKPRLLLLRLLVDANEVVSTDQLVDALWGEQPPRSATKLVQVYVSQLRRALAHDVVETAAGGYRLRVAAGELDAERFERLLEEGRQARAAGNDELAAALLRRALELWRGQALAPAEYEHFAVRGADRLESLRLDCLEERLEAELALGRHAEVLPELAALVVEEPLRERLHAAVMLALYRSGRQAEALEAYAAARRILRDQLGLEPGTELRRLQRAVLAHDPALEAPPRPAQDEPHLPAPPTPLVGREAELAALGDLVARPDVRFVTLTGAGGSGKTRLALELGRRSARRFANGVVLVELAASSETPLVPTLIAEAAGVALEGAPAEQSVAEALADRELLLLVDNVEHLAGVESVLARLVAAAPRLTILATSRRVLHVNGEHVFPVRPLPEPDAAELFVQRARAIDPALELDGSEAVVREICRRLDGLPLAIELAAARSSTLPPEALLERLSERLTVLSGGPRDLPARQRTLRETLDWSVGLLTPEQRAALARMAAFPAGCTLAAAERCGADLDVLAALVDNSLVSRVALGGEPWFVQLETVREYARGLGPGGRDDAEAVLVAYVADLLGRAELRGPEQARWFARIDAEQDNVRAALDLAAVDPDPTTSLRLVGTLWRYWWVRGRLHEGRGRIDQTLARRHEGDPEVVSRALIAGAGLAWAAGEFGPARALAEEALERSSVLFDVIGAETCLGVIAIGERDWPRARAHFTRSLEASIALESPLDILAGKLNLGVVELEAKQFADAVPYFEDVLVDHRAQDRVEGIGFAALNLGQVHVHLGRLAEAEESFEEARAAFAELGFTAHVGHALQGLAAVAARSGRAEHAAFLLGRADAGLAEADAFSDGFDQEVLEETAQLLRDALGEAGFAAAVEEGRTATG